jgi:pimeloyl-ACP methyl ester carboxylesterase
MSPNQPKLIKKGKEKILDVIQGNAKLREWMEQFETLKNHAKQRLEIAKKFPLGAEPAPIQLPVDERGFFTALDGTPIYYEVTGHGKPLIFCYGLVCRKEHWHHQIRHFCKEYQVITFDYRGHHASGIPKNDQNLTLQWCGQDVLSLMDHLGLKEAVALGHSLGVPVLTHAAALDKKRLRGLVLVCGSVINPFSRMFFSSRMDVVYQVLATSYEWAPETTTRIWKRLMVKNRLSFFITSTLGFNPNLAEEQDILLYMDGVTRCPLATFYGLLRDYVRFDGREMLKSIDVPALVIAGEDDCITPMEVQEEMASLLPKGKIRKIPRGSHNAHMDLPIVVDGEIDSFLNDLEYK